MDHDRAVEKYEIEKSTDADHKPDEKKRQDHGGIGESHIDGTREPAEKTGLVPPPPALHPAETHVALEPPEAKKLAPGHYRHVARIVLHECDALAPCLPVSLHFPRALEKGGIGKIVQRCNPAVVAGNVPHGRVVPLVEGAASMRGKKNRFAEDGLIADQPRHKRDEPDNDEQAQACDTCAQGPASGEKQHEANEQKERKTGGAGQRQQRQEERGPRQTPAGIPRPLPHRQDEEKAEKQNDVQIFRQKVPRHKNQERIDCRQDGRDPCRF